MGVLLNHAARRLTLSEINRTIKRADELHAKVNRVVRVMAELG